MVKIKDFTLASKNWGGGARAPWSLGADAHGEAYTSIRIFAKLNWFKLDLVLNKLFILKINHLI